MPPFCFSPPNLCPQEWPAEGHRRWMRAVLTLLLHHVERSVAPCCVLLHPSISLPQQSLDIATHSHIVTSPQYENQ